MWYIPYFLGSRKNVKREKAKIQYSILEYGM